MAGAALHRPTVLEVEVDRCKLYSLALGPDCACGVKELELHGVWTLTVLSVHVLPTSY